ncbi:expressed unknown protein [Seminavis robusta]|uniref:Bestrophin homolog n=1 Tax=Seminavis robusta TaxID=568900 RepID=A0A9N8HIB3_9STRA|nr:expressed unknown protein [Seminavis robusta]|eukprot:Sro584_g170790.1 n/a (505) ;mRNA; f:28921-30521
MPLATLASESVSSDGGSEDSLFLDEVEDRTGATIPVGDEQSGTCNSTRNSRSTGRDGRDSHQSKRRSICLKKAPTRQTSTHLRSSSLNFVGKFVRANFGNVVDVEYRLEQLKGIENRRRRVLNQGDQPMWRILSSYDGTVMRILAYDALFWFSICIYVGIRIVSVWELPSYLNDLPADSITVLGGFVTFFLVFWVNQSHDRFFGLYDSSMGIKGSIFNCATLGAASLPPEKVARLVRYMNCAHAAAYVGLSDVYTTGNYFNYADQEMSLLTQPERARLDHIDLDHGGSCSRELVAWCMNEIHTAERQGLINQILAKDFRDQIIKLQGHIGELFNAKDLPIPFFYVHFICLLTTLYLPLFAVTAAIQAGTGDTGWINGLIRGLVVVLQSVFVIGLRVLGQKMSDPYGDDLIDLSVMYYVHFTWQMSNRILNSHLPEEADPFVEDKLVKSRQSLGDAWPPKPKKKQGVPRKSFYYDASQSVADIEYGVDGGDYRTIRNPQQTRRGG